jgi:diguanylate cyclase (GGDEF)-like protein
LLPRLPALYLPHSGSEASRQRFVYRKFLEFGEEDTGLSAVTLADVEKLLVSSGNDARFPEAVEAEFVRRTHSFRVKVLRSSLLPTLLIYNAFLIADYILVPDTFMLAVWLHFAVVTPAILLAGLLYPRLKSGMLRNILVGSVPVLTVAQIMAIYLLNDGPDADHYQYLAIMILIFTNVNLRHGFRFAACLSAIMSAIYLAALFTGPSGAHIRFIGVTFDITVVYLTLLANYRMDRDMRHAFLRRLHDSMMREHAESRAHRDPLTGVANRHQLETYADHLWTQADDNVSPIAVIMIDVDHFKSFNDEFGHPAGDECLKRVAHALCVEMAENELVARYGGEEFIAVMPGTSLPDAAKKAERLRRAIEDIAIPHPKRGIGGVVTASFGVMAGPASLHSLSELVTGADAALYAAKRSGRNMVWPPFRRKQGEVVDIASCLAQGRDIR